jgi:dihydroorotase
MSNDSSRNQNSEELLQYDLILKNGHVIDPANNVNDKLDVGIKDGKIIRVDTHISPGEGSQVIDASEMIVTPGILDIHTHVYSYRVPKEGGITCVDADSHMFASGVTTTVDAGSTGWKNFSDFKEWTIDRSRMRILAFLNIAANGMADVISEQTPSDFHPEITASLVETFPDLIVGIKTAHYWTKDPWDHEHTPWASVENAVTAGELCQKPVMVDFWPRPPERSYPDLILKKLRPGDIHTHVFAQQFPILNESGHHPSARTNDFMFAARERGVLFDLGHGAGSFWFRNAVPAFRDGFPPDTLSTDLHTGSINGPAISMQVTMSKFLSMGMPLEEVVLRSTAEPARLIGHPELGTLSPGLDADVAVFKVLEGDFSFIDCGRARMRGTQKLECQLTLRAGQIVFDPAGLSMPEWEQAPAPYWVNPTLKQES